MRVVAKRISLAGCKPMEVVSKMEEIFMLMKFDHPNILKYFNRFEDREKQLLYIVTEYCEVLINKKNNEKTLVNAILLLSTL